MYMKINYVVVGSLYYAQFGPVTCIGQVEAK